MSQLGREKFSNEIMVREQREQVWDLSNLNFPKLKNDLRIAGNEKKLYILNAFRWKLLRSREAGAFKEAIHNLTEADLLDLRSEEKPKTRQTIKDKPVYEIIFLSNANEIHEAAILLLRLVSANFQGRSYLIQGPKLLQILCDKIIQSNLTEKTDRILLTILQRLSLRHSAIMIFLSRNTLWFIVDIMTYFADAINKEDNIQQERIIMQYLVCFLMNILVRKEGRVKATKMVEQLWALAHKLLEIRIQDEEGFNLRTHIHGVIYYLIHIPGFKKIALVF
jgi:hypothetical protein